MAFPIQLSQETTTIISTIYIITLTDTSITPALKEGHTMGGHYSTNNDNNYVLFNASGMDFIAIGLDVWPNKDELGWAVSILQKYPNRRAIVISHDVLDVCGGWRSSGEAIYNALKHNSIVTKSATGKNNLVFVKI